MPDPLPQDVQEQLVNLAAAIEEADEKIKQLADQKDKMRLEVIRLTQFTKAEGAQTFHAVSDRGKAKIVLKQPVNDSVDSERWLELRRTLPAKHPARLIFRQKFEIRKKEARALQDEDPASWAVASKVITRKPGKVSLEVSQLKLGGS